MFSCIHNTYKIAFICICITNDTYDDYLKHMYKGSFLFYYTQVCSLEYCTVKWLKQQGVVFEAMTMHVGIVPNDYVGTMCDRVIIVV